MYTKNCIKVLNFMIKDTLMVTNMISSEIKGFLLVMDRRNALIN